MMIHRHFEEEKPQNLTTLADLRPTEKKEFVSEIFPPEEPKKPKRSKKK